MTQRLFVASLVLTTTVLAADAASAAAQAASPGTPRGHRVVTASPAAVLARLEALLLTLDDGGADTETKVESLAAALTMAAAAPADVPRIQALSRELVAALAPAFVGDEQAERLAQDLFAAIRVRRLSPREAALLVEDITGILRQAGVAPVQAARVLQSLAALCGLPAVAHEAPPSSARADLRLQRP